VALFVPQLLLSIQVANLATGFMDTEASSTGQSVFWIVQFGVLAAPLLVVGHFSREARQLGARGWWVPLAVGVAIVFSLETYGLLWWDT
jgi:hypothetical protein